MERLIDHYPRYPAPLVENNGWRNKSNPQPGDWQHVCTSGTCPDGANYYVSCKNDTGSYWLMCGPFSTHIKALNAVDKVLLIADEHDGRAWFMHWGTCRTEDNKPGVLNRLGLWKEVAL